MYARTRKSLRKSLLTWAFVILPALAGCQAQDGLEANIFGSGLTADYSPGEAENARTALVPPETAFMPADPGPMVVGGIVSANTTALEDIIGGIKGKGRYENVVVVARTEHIDGENAVFTYGTAPGVKTDEEAVLKLENTGFVKNLGEVGAQSRWSGPQAEILKKNFPDAEFLFISVNEKIAPQSLNIIAYVLHTTLSDKTLFLGMTDPVVHENGKIAAFQGAFADTVLKSFDVEKFDELPVEAPSSAKLVALYLRYRGAGKTSAAVGTFAPQTLYEKGRAQSENTVYLVSFGDVMLGRYVRTLMDRHGNDYPFEKMDDRYLRVNDILLANLEGPIAKKAISTTKTIAFRFPPDTVDVLKKYRFDALSLANNHIYDMGLAGFDDTKELLDAAGIVNFGEPRDNGSSSSAVMMARGKKIAFLGLEEVVYKIDDDKAIKEIKRLVAEGSAVIPVVHWGVEYTHKPNDRQRDLARKFIDAGAIAVIGHHPHVIQAYETYKGRPIFYSLGNAVFDQYWSADTQVGMSVAMIIGEDETEIFFMPLKIVMSQVQFMDDDESKKLLEEFAHYGEGDGTEKAALAEGHLVLTAVR